MTRRRKWTRWAVIFVALAAVLVAAAIAINRGISWRTQFPIVSASISDDGYALTLLVGTCGGEPELSLLREDGETVEVSVTSTRTLGGPGGEDCLDPVVAELNNPMDDRSLIDAASGDVVNVSVG